MTARLCVLFSSSRAGGNSEQLGDAVLSPLPAGAVDRIYLRQFRVEPVVDCRHEPPSPEWRDDYPQLVRRMLRAEALLIVTPTYWYSLPGHLKNFMDRWTASMRDPGLVFRERMRDRPLFLAVVHGDDEPEAAAPVIESLRLTARYLEMRWGGYVCGRGNRPGDLVRDPVTLEAARRLLLPWWREAEEPGREPG